MHLVTPRYIDAPLEKPLLFLKHIADNDIIELTSVYGKVIYSFGFDSNQLKPSD